MRDIPVPASNVNSSNRLPNMLELRHAGITAENLVEPKCWVAAIPCDIMKQGKVSQQKLEECWKQYMYAGETARPLQKRMDEHLRAQRNSASYPKNSLLHRRTRHTECEIIPEFQLQFTPLQNKLEVARGSCDKASHSKDFHMQVVIVTLSLMSSNQHSFISQLVVVLLLCLLSLVSPIARQTPMQLLTCVLVDIMNCTACLKVLRHQSSPIKRLYTGVHIKYYENKL